MTFSGRKLRNCKFDLSGDEEYGLIPSFQAHVMMERGVVPVKDTMSVLGRLALEKRTMMGSVVEHVTKNRLLYRSALCVAFRTLESKAAEARICSKSTMHVVLHLLAEAYAATVERIAGAFAESQEHRLFYLANSEVDRGKMPILLECVATLGPQKAFLLYMVGDFRVRIGGLWNSDSTRELIETWRSTDWASGRSEDEMMVERMLTNTMMTNAEVVTASSYHYFDYRDRAQEYALLCTSSDTEWYGEISIAFDWLGPLISQTVE